MKEKKQEGGGLTFETRGPRAAKKKHPIKYTKKIFTYSHNYIVLCTYVAIH